VSFCGGLQRCLFAQVSAWFMLQSESAPKSPSLRCLFSWQAFKTLFSTDEMSYTNYTYDFRGIIDYIWFTKEYLSCRALLGGIPVCWFIRIVICCAFLIIYCLNLSVEPDVCYACTQQESYLKNYLGCPNAYFPSDHFPLVCEFRLGASDAAK
jgi:hypothetical protein